MGGRIDYFLVYRGDKPCVLLTSAAHYPKGVLTPVIDEAPTRFICDRVESDRFATVFARRRAAKAIERSMKWIR